MSEALKYQTACLLVIVIVVEVGALARKAFLVQRAKWPGANVWHNQEVFVPQLLIELLRCGSWNVADLGHSMINT